MSPADCGFSNIKALAESRQRQLSYALLRRFKDYVECLTSWRDENRSMRELRDELYRDVEQICDRYCGAQDRLIAEHHQAAMEAIMHGSVPPMVFNPREPKA